MKNIQYFGTLFLLTFFASCADYLDVVPDGVATINHAFTDRYRAESFLHTCYSYLPAFGDVVSDPTLMGSDEIWAHEDQNYYWYTGNFKAFRIKQKMQNASDPLLGTWNNLYIAIRDCNIFLENIHRVGNDLKTDERNRWIAEVKFLKAYYHFHLLRMYGAIPLVRENLPISAGSETVRVYRDPFDECVDYIVELLDEAVPNLPLSISNIINELGRITQPIALSLKAQVLVLAASPLFNGNSDYKDVVDNRGIHLFPFPEQPKKWERAAIACKNAIDTCHLAGIKLYEFNPSEHQNVSALSDTTRLLMSLRHVFMDKWNQEIIWGSTKRTWDTSRGALPYFTTEEVGNVASNPILSPTFRMAELFYTNHGVPIEEDITWVQDYPNRYKTTPSPDSHRYFIQTGFETARLHINRETRFYANMGFDGGYWFGNGRYKDVGMGTSAETPWLMKMKKGEASGKISNLRYSITGYWSKKLNHFQSKAEKTDVSYGAAAFPIIRLADLYLLYAEALNESMQAPTAEVYEYIDRVREHAGLKGVVESWSTFSRLANKPTTQDGMRDIIRQERTVELAFEGKRFWDLRRWKTAQDWMNRPIRSWNINSETTTEYYNVLTIYSLEFTTKEYLWPIALSETRKNKNLVQNLGW